MQVPDRHGLFAKNSRQFLFFIVSWIHFRDPSPGNSSTAALPAAIRYRPDRRAALRSQSMKASGNCCARCTIVKCPELNRRGR